MVVGKFNTFESNSPFSFLFPVFLFSSVTERNWSAQTVPNSNNRGGPNFLLTVWLFLLQRTNRAPKDIHVEPERFATELIGKLEGVLKEREAREKLEERLKRVRLVPLVFLLSVPKSTSWFSTLIYLTKHVKERGFHTEGRCLGSITFNMVQQGQHTHTKPTFPS